MSPEGSVAPCCPSGLRSSGKLQQVLVETCSIITTTLNAFCADGNDRMPLILLPQPRGTRTRPVKRTGPANTSPR